MRAAPAQPAGGLSAEPSAASVLPFYGRARGAVGAGFVALLLALGALSALKGLNLGVHYYASYFYYADYRFGLIQRGLVGQLFAPVLDALPPSAHHDLLLGWHFAGLAVLIAALARLAARTVDAAGGRADVAAAAVLLVCSPLIPSLAYFTASPDALLCLLTLGMVAAARARRHALACALFLAGALAHQLMIFLALPLLVLASLTRAERPVPAVAGAVVAGMAACLFVVVTPAPDGRFVERLVQHGVPLEEARGLLERQLGQGVAEMLRVMAGLWRANLLNGGIALVHGAATGVAILAVCLATPGVLGPVAARLPASIPGRLRSALAALLVVAAGLGPLLVLAFAWDLTRLAVLSAFTSFLTADLLLRDGRTVAAAPRPGRLGTLGCAVLAAAFLCQPFVGLWFTGSFVNTLMPVVLDPVLRFEPTRSVVREFRAFYDRNEPR